MRCNMLQIQFPNGQLITNRMILNTDKTKEMVIYFGKRIVKDEIKVTCIQTVAIERVDTFKLLGVIFSSDLTWGKHVDYIVTKASRRLYVIYQLIRAGIPVADAIVVYCSLIRSILEYACQVWHCGLTKSQSDDIENVQRRCLRIIFRELSYKDALQITELDLLSIRREKSVIKLFNEIKILIIY